jgi:two-component system response regulator MtrA
MSGSILFVEDDMSVQEATSLLLERAGLHVTGVTDGRKALEVFADRHFDVVVLDLMLPSLDGLTVCREMRGMSRVPIVILTARADPNDIVAGLEAGADDYVTKPFHGPELLARVRAALRRVVPDDRSPVLHVGSLEINCAAFRVTDDGRPIDLSVTEFRLLVELARHTDRVLTREALVERVWGYAYLGDSRLVDMAIKRLRSKIGDDPHHPRYIETVRGVGYRFITPGPDSPEAAADTL